MDDLDSCIIFQICKFCDIKSLNNLTKVNLNFKNKRLYRLFIGKIANFSYGLDTLKEIHIYKDDGYRLNDYLFDIIHIFHYDTTVGYYYRKKNLSYIGYSSNWYSLLNLSREEIIDFWHNKRYEKNRMYNIRLCNVYRISLLLKKLYKKNYGYNLLSIIY